MTVILIQNIFNDHRNNGYLLACKPNGEIAVGNYIILKKNIEAKIITIEKGLFDTLIIGVSENLFSEPDVNYDFLHKKEFEIRSDDSE